jgi:hypothetical protein
MDQGGWAQVYIFLCNFTKKSKISSNSLHLHPTVTLPPLSSASTQRRRQQCSGASTRLHRLYPMSPPRSCSAANNASAPSPNDFANNAAPLPCRAANNATTPPCKGSTGREGVHLGRHGHVRIGAGRV